MLTLSYLSPRVERAAAAGTPYSLTLKNNSAQSWTFYVYQKAPQLTPSVFSLAWFASPYRIRPGGDQITFRWEIDYNFVWSDTGILIPGVTFHASGTVDCDPASRNTTTFDLADGPGFSSPVAGEPKGSLVIKDGADVPNNRFSVGIGMSGTGTYAVQAGTNLTHMFTPTPSYWVAAGVGVQIGSVLDIKTVTQTAEAKYDPNVYNVEGTLGPDNLWTFRNL